MTLLAKGSDAALRTAAQTELSNPTDPSAMAELADLWWDMPAAAHGPSTDQARRRAAHWYGRAVPRLSGLRKSVAEKRLAESQQPGGGGAAAVATRVPPKRVVNILTLIDPRRDLANSAWKRQRGALMSPGDLAGLLQLPYRPPEEYDVTIEFTSTGGTHHDVGLFLPKGDTAFQLALAGWNNRWAGFGLIGGKHAHENATRTDLRLQKGKRYVCTVQVRNDGVSASLDGKPLCQWKTDYKDMSLPTPVPDARRLTLIATLNQITFHKVSVAELAGRGEVVH